MIFFSAAFLAKCSATVVDNSDLFFLFKFLITFSVEDDDIIVIFFASSIICALIFFEDLETLNLYRSFETFLSFFLTLNASFQFA